MSEALRLVFVGDWRNVRAALGQPSIRQRTSTLDDAQVSQISRPSGEQFILIRPPNSNERGQTHLQLAVPQGEEGRLEISVTEHFPANLKHEAARITAKLQEVLTERAIRS